MLDQTGQTARQWIHSDYSNIYIELHKAFILLNGNSLSEHVDFI